MNAVERIIEKCPFNGECINVSSGVETDIRTASTYFVGLMGSEYSVEFSNVVKVGDPNNWRADIDLLKSYGFEPKVSIEEGLEKYLEWLQNL